VPSNIKFILAIDLETTGLDPEFHEITQIAAKLLDRDLNELMSFNSYVNILYPERGIKEGFNVFEYTGIEKNSLKNWPDLNGVLTNLMNSIQNHLNKASFRSIVPLGQNIKFDIGFLKVAFRKTNRKYPFDYHSISTDTLFFALHHMRHGNFPKSVKLKTICEALGVKNKKEHDAMADIEATIEVYKKMLEIYRNAVPSKQTKLDL
jgi:DNA polymerase III epsilon subunit-like protein